MNREQLSNSTTALLLAPVAISGDTHSNYVDLQGWDAATFYVAVGDIGATSSSYYLTPVLREASATPGTIASYSAVAAADYYAGDSGGFIAIDGSGDESSVYKLAYTGTERYVNILLDETGVISGPVCVWVELHNANQQPSDGLTVTTGTVT